MTLARGWKARQEAAIKKAAMRDKMHEMNRLRASVVGVQVDANAIVPVPPVQEIPVQADGPVDDDQFDPVTDVKPEPTPTATRARKKA